MTLPSSGKLSLKDIGVELGIPAGNTVSLRSLSNTAGKSVPDAISEFYGYTAGDTITASFGTATILRATTLVQEAYRPITISGMSAGTTIRIQVSVNLSTNSNPSNVLEVAWSLNSISTWNTFAMVSSVGTTYYYIPISPNYVSSTDTLRVYWYAEKLAASNSMAWTISLTNLYQVVSGSVASFTGSGTWSKTWSPNGT